MGAINHYQVNVKRLADALGFEWSEVADPMETQASCYSAGFFDGYFAALANMAESPPPPNPDAPPAQGDGATGSSGDKEDE